MRNDFRRAFRVVFAAFILCTLLFAETATALRNSSNQQSAIVPPMLAVANVNTPSPRFDTPWLTFNSAVTADSGSPVAMAVGDVDGDGHPDVVTARGYVGGGGFVFLRNEGNGRFAQPVT